MNIKKKLIIVLMVITLSLTGCGESSHQKDKSNNNTLFDQFVIVKDTEYDAMNDEWYDFYIVYDKDTKVMYYFANGFRRAMMSPIYNSDGTVKIWEDN